MTMVSRLGGVSRTKHSGGLSIPVACGSHLAILTDAMTVIGFLKHFGLDSHFKVISSICWVSFGLVTESAEECYSVQRGTVVCRGILECAEGYSSVLIGMLAWN